MRSFEGGKAEIEATPTQPEQLVEVKRPAVCILVLGFSGSGKTTFIDTVCTEHDRNGDVEKPATNDVVFRKVSIYKQSYELIDTPGFDNPDLSSYDVFARIADCLLSEPRIRQGVTGIVYVHRTGDPLRSRALVQTMRVLSDIFLGRGWFPRLKILAVPNSTGKGFPKSFHSAMSHQSSAFAQAIAEGAEIIISDFDQVDFENVLMSYASTGRALLRIQDECLKNPHTPVGPRIEDYLGHTENRSLQLRIDARVEELQRTHQDELVALQSALQGSEEMVSEYSKHLKLVESKLTNQCDEGNSLRQQLQRTQTEYASLRSQLQLQENVEQTDIVQALKDLNRAIDDLGRTVSAFLVDNYVRALINKDPSKATALDARNLPDLKKLLSHVDGCSSLVMSWSRVGMRIEDFFDYAIRALLCRELCKWIFDPFHPAVNTPFDNVITDMYNDIRHKEPQATAAKWRENSFKTVYVPDSPDEISERLTSITQRITRTTFNYLISFYFGKDTGITLKSEHHDSLERLVRTAWDWNTTLKEKVLVLGDFQPTYYRFGIPFDPQLMDEFEAAPGGQNPRAILATIGLGLNSSRAVGGGHPPEVTHVCKAIVATRILYA